MRRLICILLLVLAVPAFAQEAPKDKDKKPEETFNIEASIVMFRVINKVTGRISKFSGKVGETVKFGNLEIQIRRCQKSRPTEPPERGAFLQIYEKSLKSDKLIRVFSGWMFSSNPALSAMEHPVYDVWITDCK